MVEGAACHCRVLPARDIEVTATYRRLRVAGRVTEAARDRVGKAGGVMAGAASDCGVIALHAVGVAAADDAEMVGDDVGGVRAAEVVQAAPGDRSAHDTRIDAVDLGAADDVDAA